MPRCAGVTRSGDQCSAAVRSGERYCFNHDPERAAERKANAAKAGSSKPTSEIRELKDQLSQLYENLTAGRVDRGAAAVLNQILGTRVRVLALERDLREQEELAQRIARLEETL